MEIWHDKGQFKDSEQRRKELCRFANYYNTLKLHSGLKGGTPSRCSRLIFLNLLCKKREDF
ncbi:hypothetical protein LVJ88_03095 [Neisseria dumasiana]|nr:hypothetical protein [Neisseria dumasiana]UOO85559.1 hypothetical protein LVJ88_03095 [Neisseria dumasiana]